MSTSYADSAQAREWDRRYDDRGRPRMQADAFHEYETHAERDVRLLAERKASAKRVSAAVEQIGDFWGLNEVKP